MRPFMLVLLWLSASVQGRQTVFRVDEPIEIPVPAPGEWRIINVDGKEIARGDASPAKISNSGPGYFELITSDQKVTSFAVVRSNSTPVPKTSPIGVDVAMSWFYKGEQRQRAARICAAANINWVRDRLNWGEVEKTRGTFESDSRYDQSAAIQSDAGLQILQVNHASPNWSGAESNKRFPPDLRDVHRFYREMANRWKGKVEAFEPWNEADIEHFGGHTGAEIASLQKAAYLGIKAGNPQAIAGMAVFAINRPATLEDFAANRAESYFDTTNLHHYAPLDKLPAWYASFRAISGGTPLWVSECAMPVKWAGDEKAKELTRDMAREQARRVARTFATSIYEGSRVTFYFMLPHYSEGQTQFGLLRPDLSPRPGYSALAAVGHFLSDAQRIGKVTDRTAYVFRARPGNGEQREVLVAWGPGQLNLPAVPLEMADHFGRGIPPANPLKLDDNPLFAVFPLGTFARTTLAAPPPTLSTTSLPPSPIVMQMIGTSQETRIERSAYRLLGNNGEWPLFFYNFSDKAATGRLSVSAADGWNASIDPRITIASGDRRRIPVRIQPAPAARWASGRITITGDFDEAGNSTFSALFLPHPGPLDPSIGVPIANSADANAWRTEISSGSTLKLAQVNAARIRAEASFAPGDKWLYPRLPLIPESAPPTGPSELAIPLKLIEGQATFRAIFVEENGASYVVDSMTLPERDKEVTLEFLLAEAKLGEGWSKADDNNKLDPEKIIAIKIGCNTRDTKVVYETGPARWVK